MWFFLRHRLSLGHSGQQIPVSQLQNGVSTSPLPTFIVDMGKSSRKRFLRPGKRFCRDSTVQKLYPSNRQYSSSCDMTGEPLVNHTSSIPSLLNLSPVPILVTSGSGCTPRGFGVEWSAYQTPTWVIKSPNHQETKSSVFLTIALTFEVTSLKNCRKVPFFNGKLSCGVLEGTTKLTIKFVTYLSTNTAFLVSTPPLAAAGNPAGVQHRPV